MLEQITLSSSCLGLNRAFNCIMLCAGILRFASTLQINAQGVLHFANITAAGVNARVTFLDGTPVGSGYTAQLYGGPAGSSIASLQPLFLTTTFYAEPAAYQGYVHPVPVYFPGIPSGLPVTVVMRVYGGSSWEESVCRGESMPIEIELGGGTVPPNQLRGLEPFSVNCIPEPATWVLLLSGLVAATLNRSCLRFKRANQWVIFCSGVICLASALQTHAQGAVEFANAAGGVNAPVTFLDGTPVGAGYTAQLYGGPAGSSVASLQPLIPTTTFYTERPGYEGYVRDVVVTFPGISRGAIATIVMRVYDGPNWEDSVCRGESLPIEVQTGGGTRPPTPLFGLQPFSVNCIPEPATWVLLLSGLIAALVSRPGTRSQFFTRSGSPERGA